MTAVSHAASPLHATFLLFGNASELVDNVIPERKVKLAWPALDLDAIADPVGVLTAQAATIPAGSTELTILNIGGTWFIRVGPGGSPNTGAVDVTEFPALHLRTPVGSLSWMPYRFFPATDLHGLLLPLSAPIEITAIEADGTPAAAVSSVVGTEGSTWQYANGTQISVVKRPAVGAATPGSPARTAVASGVGLGLLFLAGAAMLSSNK